MTSPKYLTPEDLAFGLEEGRVYINHTKVFGSTQEMRFLEYQVTTHKAVWAHFKILTGNGHKDFYVGFMEDVECQIGHKITLKE